MITHTFFALVWLLTIPTLSAYSSNDHQSLETITLGAHTLSVEIAKTPKDRAHGLMFRKSLPEDQGMFFIFPAPQRVSFWMKNTSIPLDIAFFDEQGIMLEVHLLEPFNESPIRSENSNILYALEVNQGFFKKQNISIGDKLTYP